MGAAGALCGHLSWRRLLILVSKAGPGLQSEVYKELLKTQTGPAPGRVDRQHVLKARPEGQRVSLLGQGEEVLIRGAKVRKKTGQ